MLAALADASTRKVPIPLSFGQTSFWGLQTQLVSAKRTLDPDAGDWDEDTHDEVGHNAWKILIV